MPTTPRRMRSPADEEDRESDRQERRRINAPPGVEPVGFGFRLNAIEQTLREHAAHIAAQSVKQQNSVTAIDDIKTSIGQLREKLEGTFRDWNTRLNDMNRHHTEGRGELQMLIQNMSLRADAIEGEIRKGQSMPPASGPSAPQPEQFHMGSPATPPAAPTVPNSWSPLNPNEQPQQDAWSQYHSRPSQPYSYPGVPPGMPQTPPQMPQTSVPGTWAAGFGTDIGPWHEKDWTVSEKVSRELKSFDGQIGHYDNWRIRVRDHFVATNVHYSHIFDLLEQTRTIIGLKDLASLKVTALPNINWNWIASHIWTFVGKWMTDTQLNRRLTLAQGEAYNGTEVWRALFHEYSGGSNEMKKNERSYFINFPKCVRDEDLHAHLQQWNTLRAQYGNGLPEDHLEVMFHDILPEAVSKEVRNQRDLVTLGQKISWVNGELTRLNDSRLSKWNMLKLTQQLKGTPKIPVNPLMTENSETSDPVPPPPVADMASFQATMERMIAAAMNQRGRSDARTPPGSRSGTPRRTSNIPSPKFDGCWCCGDKAHSRQNCPKFKAIKEANGGMVPKDYEGAYEKSRKAKPSPARPKTAVGAVTAVPNDAKKSDHDETYIWPLITTQNRAKDHAPRATPTQNSFQALKDEGETDDEESDIVKALSQLTSNITFGRAKKQKKKKGLDIARISAIAKEVRDGKIKLPDLRLDNDEEYSCVWALVDSGAGVHCADDDQFENAEDTKAPDVLLTTADGNHMAHKGAMKVTTKSQEGIETTRVFYRAPVDMPILAVAMLTQEGRRGSTAGFKQRRGVLEDDETGARQHFVKRKGVYFMKLYSRRRVGVENQDFQRPGTP